jgi:hypothetical protein
MSWEWWADGEEQSKRRSTLPQLPLVILPETLVRDTYVADYLSTHTSLNSQIYLAPDDTNPPQHLSSAPIPALEVDEPPPNVVFVFTLLRICIFAPLPPKHDRNPQSN